MEKPLMGQSGLRVLPGPSWSILVCRSQAWSGAPLPPPVVSLVSHPGAPLPRGSRCASSWRPRDWRGCCWR